MQKNSSMKNAFEEINERYNIKEVAQDLGITLKRCGGSYRSNSICTAGGQNAFAVWERSNRWYDFAGNIGGDITDLVAFYKFDGDKSKAIKYLLPDRFNYENAKIYVTKEAKAKKAFQELVNIWHKALFENDNNKVESVKNVFEYLHSRKVDNEQIKRLKIGFFRYERLLLPTLSEDGTEAVYFHTRRLPKADGYENEKEPKYLKPSKEQYPYLKNIPMGLQTLKQKSEENNSLVITEGIFDYLAFEKEGFPVLSTGGGHFGDSLKLVLDRAGDFKRVVLAFDNDEAGKNFTKDMAKILMENNIPFSVIQLLDGIKDISEYYTSVSTNLQRLVDNSIDGLSWLANSFKRNGDYNKLTPNEKHVVFREYYNFLKNCARWANKVTLKELNNQLKDYFPADLLKEALASALKGPDNQQLAQEICDKCNISYDDRTGVYIYTQRGIWKHLTDNQLLNIVIKHLGKRSDYPQIRKVAHLIKILSQDDNLVTKLDKLPRLSMKNGTLRIDFQRGFVYLNEHSKEDYATSQAKYCYQEEQKESKIFLPALRKMVSEDGYITIQEFAGYTLLNNCKFHKALIATGVGGNGKSLVTDVLSAMLGGIDEEGKGLITHVQFSKLGKDFRTMVLKNSWLNISSETEIDITGAEANIKSIIAGDVIEDSYKGKDPISFIPRVKLWVNCNEFPRFSDKSKGMTRRLLFVDFPVNFVDDPRPGTDEKQAIYNLSQKIIEDQDEMAAVLNWAIEGLFRIIKQNGFTKTQTQNEMRERFENYNNPIKLFFNERPEFLNSDLPRFTLYNLYKEWCIGRGEIVYSARYFYEAARNTLRGMSVNLEEHQVFKEGRFWKISDPLHPKQPEEEAPPEEAEKPEQTETTEATEEYFDEFKEAREQVEQFEKLNKNERDNE